MKFNIKSKKGFTLIELLVVIGILAVLAAIAIPSVAGLIDRANVSADNTNANEMTNAMERFVSEYELYKQDIASGAIKDGDDDGVPDNMDAAQSRVYNVTKAITRADIEALEGPIGLNGIRIDIDNKYAQNSTTAKAVMENYMKTSSSTFEPKQSDMTYWYHTMTGYTVVADKNADIETLTKLLPQELSSSLKEQYVTYWIDLSSSVPVPDLQITNMQYYDTGATKNIVFSVDVPNPKYNYVNFSKMHLLSKNIDSDELNIQSATRNVIVSWDEEDLKAFDDIYTSTVSCQFVIKYDSNESLDTIKQFRIAYEYEESGRIAYAYTPIFSTSYNELVNAGARHPKSKS